MKKTKFMPLIVTLSFISSYLPAQNNLVNKQQLTSSVDNLIQKVMGKLPVPAMAISIVDENGPLLAKGYGWADKEAAVKTDENTLFYIASNTKAFVGLAAALLDHEKKIFLDSSFKKYFTTTKFKNEIGSNVTIRNLLTHTSGLENNALVFRMAFSGAIHKDEIAQVLSNATVANKKHGVYDYDNLGYNIYGLLLQEYLHKKWQDLLQEKIFTPLEMKKTTAYISVAEKNKWAIAAPYSAFGENGLSKVYLAKKDNTMQSAGGLVTSASDISKWLQMLINKGKINNRQLYPPEIISSAYKGFASYERKAGDSTITMKYGLGWNESKHGNEDFIYHTGGYPGFRSFIAFMPVKKIGAAVMANEGSVGSEAADMVAQYIFDQVAGVANAEELFNKKLDQLVENYAKGVESVKRSYADRATRTSQLTLPLDAYTGKYSHPFYGDIIITIKNNTLAVSFGNLYAVSTPFTQKETIRVQLMPDQGQVVSFKTNEPGKIDRLTYNGNEYKKN